MSIFRIFLSVALLILVGLEIGILKPVFDSRSVVEDGVIGTDYWIIKVDGEPTARVQNGIVISKVPLALIEPGERLLHLSKQHLTASASEIVELRATIRKGLVYRIIEDTEGNPKLVEKK